jgi:hypothetical protein
MKTVKKYLLYLVRWQLSTPILTVVIWWLADFSSFWQSVVANLIGGLIFFWIDKYIFRQLSDEPMWEIKENVACADCGKVGTGYRIVEWMGYNRHDDKHPQYRCEHCREIKMKQVEQEAHKHSHSKSSK